MILRKTSDVFTSFIKIHIIAELNFPIISIFSDNSNKSLLQITFSMMLIK